MGRIFITGDTHGDLCRLTEFNMFMNEDDYIIVAGDFGYLFNRRYWASFVKNVKSIKGKILFIDGNHENFDWLNEFPVCKWNDGKIHVIIKNKVMHLMRGQVFNIEGKSIFTFGGGRSVDVTGGIFSLDDPELEQKILGAQLIGKPYRIDHFTWWKEEMASDSEKEEAIRNLNKVNNKVDYIITHCIGSNWYKRLECELGIYRMEIDAMSDWLAEIQERVKYKKWYFGHYHKDIELDEKHIMLYFNIKEIK